MNDVTIAGRTLVKHRGFTAVVVLTLALGIGATTALFSVAYGVLLAPLPYSEPDRLVRLTGEMTARGVPYFPESPTNVEDYRAQATLFSDIAGVFIGNGTFARAGETPRRVAIGIASWNLMDLLGVEPLVGRNLGAADGAFSATDVPAAAQFPADTFATPRTALISYRMWQSDFEGRGGVVGEQFELNGEALEIVGVLPASFRLYLGPSAGATAHADVWVPLRVDYARAVRNNTFLHMIGRLNDGVSVAQAQAEINSITDRLNEDNAVMRAAGKRVHVVEYADDMVSDSRTAIWTLLGAAAIVLLIACANVANMLLVRAVGRGRELSIRAAMGASRAVLVRQMLVEALVIAGLAAAVGLALAYAGVELLVGAVPANIARLDTVGINVAALAAAVLAALLATVLAGLAPSLRASRAQAAGALRARSGSTLDGGNRLRWGLVTAEVALSFVLLVGAGLMVRSLVALQDVDLGFAPDPVMTFQIALPNRQYPDVASRRSFYLELQRRLEALPGVRHAAAAGPLPLSGLAFHGRYATIRPATEDAEYRQANYRTVLPGYFEAMQTPLLAGRLLTHDDEINERAVIVVDDVLAEASWPEENPIGKQLWLRLLGPEPAQFEVVGVVRRQRQENLYDAPRDSVYFTAAQSRPFGVNGWVVLSDMPPSEIMPLVRREVAELDPGLPIALAQPMTEYVDAAMGRTRFALQLIGVFAVAAALIAAVGLYAAIHFLVQQRRAEIGVRMSFGARRSDIFRLFLGRGMLLVGAGLALGLVAALVASRSMSTLVVGVAATDSATYAVIAVTFVAVTLIASAIPAWRATQVDPMEVLRDE